METPETLPDGRRGLSGLKGFISEVPAEGPVQIGRFGAARHRRPERQLCKFYSAPASRSINVDGCRPSFGPVQSLSIMSILLCFDPCAVEGISAAVFLRTEHSSTPARWQDLLHRFTSTKCVETTPRRQLPRTAPFSTPTGRVWGTSRRLPASERHALGLVTGAPIR